MRYPELEHLSNAEFKRLCGVSRETFGEMVEVLRPHLDRQGQRGGQAKLRVEDQLLVALEYWREYRSQFTLGSVGESTKPPLDALLEKSKTC
ncbi:hypothetical protein [Leptolyngbya sp. NK1-12]|uniref:hypothetical protein n=1 Tax=Leptolyngbya sp. NK1-12 TaxID=2547451 RepID=UPI00292FDA80|nr:hypothetical protein [Leptolyngbya sp. NK1-12]